MRALLSAPATDEPQTELGASPHPRWQPSGRAVLGLGAALLLVVVVTVAWVFSSRPQPLTVTQDPSPGASSAGAAGTTTSVHSATPSATAIAPAGELVVDVEGKVRHPGLYRLASGARVDDALRAAGGTLSGVGAAGLNRAAKLTDGQQLLVGSAQATGPSTPVVGDPTAAAGATSTSTSVDINTADLTQLQQLPGVGPVLAQHILDWRTQHGSFARIDQLQQVSGIGPSKFAAMKDLVTL